MSSENTLEELATNAGSGSELAGVVEQNIDSLVKMRLAKEREKNVQERIADALTRFSGSMVFVYVHAVWFGVWIAFNVGWLGRQPFDPFLVALIEEDVNSPAACREHSR